MRVAHRMVAAGLVGTSLFIAGPALLGPVRASAAPVLVQTAWWWVPQPGPPSGTVVPDGGLLVQGQPTGAVAEAAILATVAGAPEPVLELSLDGRSVGVQDGRIIACPAESAWQPGPAQPWSNRPRADCSKAVPGSVSPDGATVTFQVASLARDGGLDVVLLPGTIPSLPPSANGSTFSAVFDRPTGSALKSSSQAPPGTPGPAKHAGVPGPTTDANAGPSASQAATPASIGSADSGSMGPVPAGGSSGAVSGTAPRAGTATVPSPSGAPVAPDRVPSAQPLTPAASGPPAVLAGIGASRRTRWLLTLGVVAAGLAAWRLPSARAGAITSGAGRIRARARTIRRAKF